MRRLSISPTSRPCSLRIGMPSTWRISLSPSSRQTGCGVFEGAVCARPMPGTQMSASDTSATLAYFIEPLRTRRAPRTAGALAARSVGLVLFRRRRGRRRAGRRRALHACAALVARGAVELGLIHDDRVLLALGRRRQLQIRPGNDDFLLADAREATDADDGVADFAGLRVDQQLVDLSEVFAIRTLDAGADDVLRLVQRAGVLPRRCLGVARVGRARGLSGNDERGGDEHRDEARK